MGILLKRLEQFSKVSKYGGQPQWKTTPMEETSMEDDLNAGLPQWKKLEIRKTCFQIFVYLIMKSLEQFPKQI